MCVAVCVCANSRYGDSRPQQFRLLGGRQKQPASVLLPRLQVQKRCCDGGLFWFVLWWGKKRHFASCKSSRYCLDWVLIGKFLNASAWLCQHHRWSGQMQVQMERMARVGHGETITAALRTQQTFQQMCLSAVSPQKMCPARTVPYYNYCHAYVGAYKGSRHDIDCVSSVLWYKSVARYLLVYEYNGNNPETKRHHRISQV